jgi:hypothetical protein
VTAPGVTVIPLVAPSREEQLQAEVNELHAQLEMARAELATYPHRPISPVAILGGYLIGEADGWMWLVVSRAGANAHRLWRADADELSLSAGVRAHVERMMAERRSMAS